MERFALLAILEAKPGQEKAVQEFFMSALPLVQSEADTIAWYALQLGPSTFGIFDTFADQDGRDAHLSGALAKALLEEADSLFTSAPAIRQADILVVKSPRR